ncbi:MAG TPA: DUF1538 domain-containing protein [Clostridiales bacterium]|nr:DUF1538 domain-containing protein [Clostridiales bacterium]
MRTLLPVMVLVLVLCFTIVDAGTDLIVRFLAGSLMLLIGLSIFLRGIDMAMAPIGEHMSWEVATSRSPIKIAILSFLLGFLINVAEPDLLILGSQIERASGGTMNSFIIVYMVSVGVGIMVSFGVFRLLRDRKFNVFMGITYSFIIVLAYFVSEEFLAISFDASGATTGALTTPFILALSLGLSNMKGGRHAEENSFGLVGTMSAGPIWALMLMSIVTRQKHIHGAVEEFVVAKGILQPILDILPDIFLESVIALLPVSALFFVFNIAKFKISRQELGGILKGLLATLIGLTMFLTAVNSGFMDMGRVIGMQLAEFNRWLLVGVGFLVGLIVVLVEPAVHVLGEQIQEVSGGHIPVKIIRMTLSLGVGIAIALSMVRIAVPEVKLWYFLIPGFAISVLLSFRSDPVFVGIAYDAGGVASGPMTATFVLAFAQGAASVIDTANVLVDGFGVIAMVAMAPVLSLTALGTSYRKRRIVKSPAGVEPVTLSHLPEESDMPHECIVAVVNRGFAEAVVDVARQSGAKGATIVHGRGTDERQTVTMSIMNIELQPEKEIIFLVMNTPLSDAVATKLVNDERLEREAEISVYVAPANFMNSD